MSKYKIGDKVILTVTGVKDKERYPYYMFNNNKSNLWQSNVDKYAEPLSTYTEPLESKIQKQSAEILKQKEIIDKLLNENEKLMFKIDSYELYGDQHEEEYNQNFNQGAEAAWELAKKIVAFKCDGGYDLKEIKELFGYDCIQDIMKNLTYPEAAAKVEAWEKAKEEIKVGDEVEKNDLRDVRFIVTFTNGRLMSGVDQSGLVLVNEKLKEWHKTGRHIDVDSFLKQIGEE